MPGCTPLVEAPGGRGLEEARSPPPSPVMRRWTWASAHAVVFEARVQSVCSNREACSNRARVRITRSCVQCSAVQCSAVQLMYARNRWQTPRTHRRQGRGARRGARRGERPGERRGERQGERRGERRGERPFEQVPLSSKKKSDSPGGGSTRGFCYQGSWLQG